MDSYFEDSHSPVFSPDPQNLFYCFMNSTMNHDLPIPAHWHYYVEILYCTLGSGFIYLNGEHLTLTQGEFLFILPKDVHSIFPLEQIDFEYGVIKFDPVLLFDFPSKAVFIKYLSAHISPCAVSLRHVSGEGDFGFIKEKFFYILTLFNERSYAYELLIRSEIISLFYFFLQKLKEHDVDLLGHALSQNDISSILPAFEYAATNFQEEISSKKAAEICHLSYSYFSRKFKEISGVAFSSYVNHLRLQEAERLLLSHSYNITEVASLSGFYDVSYFISQFKKVKHITPKQFLKNLDHYTS